MDTPAPSLFAGQIDPVADRFEAIWKSGERAEPGDFLTLVPGAARPELLVKLVQIEVEYRRKIGEDATESQYLKEYQRRYADVEGLVIIPGPQNRRVRIFISSPADVSEERVLATKLVRRLSAEYQNLMWIEPIIWEHEPLLASDSFQNQIPRPSQSEIVVCILWSRLGTRLPADITRPDGTRYASGTEYEFEDAVEGRKKNGYPDLLVYRKTAPRTANLDEDREVLNRRFDQKEILDAFIQKWFFHGNDGSLKAAFHAFGSTADFEEVLEHHLRKLIQRRVPAAPADHALTLAKPSWTGESPFRGLEVFDFQHAPIFFGRTKAIGGVLSVLRQNAATGRGFVLILGPSGSGKSSLARAGVLPLLIQPGVIEGVALWRRAIMRPTDSPGNLFLSLALALLQPDALPELAADGTKAEQLARELRECPQGIPLLVKGGLLQAASSYALEKKLGAHPETRLALLVDQLEEIFTHRDVTAADRTAFIDAVSMLARSNRVFVIATLRSDFYDRCSELPALIALKEGAGQYDLLPPSAADISQMIRQPAFAAGVQFEEDPVTGTRLDDLLRDAAAEHPESLPLLEFALERLFATQDKDRKLLLLKEYEAMGGVEGALSNQAEASFREASAAAQASFSKVFRKLVSLSTDKDPVRVPALRKEVDTDPGSRELVDKLIADRLLVAGSEGEEQMENRVVVVRLAHEAILRRWPLLAEWIEKERENLKSHAEVTTDAKRWDEQGRLDDFLYSGGLPLDRAQKLLRSGFLNSREEAFVVASLRKVAQSDFEKSLANGASMLEVSQRVRSEYPDLHEKVMRTAISSPEDTVRENAATLLGKEPPDELTSSLVDTILTDRRDGVRRAAAGSLIQLDRGEYFDRIIQIQPDRSDTEVVRALACVRVAADAVTQPTKFESRYKALNRRRRLHVKMQASLIRLMRDWPTLVILAIPAVIISATFAAVFKAFPGAFNYALCQAHASAPSGAFHAIIGCVLWGGMITFCITFHRIVFRSELGKKSIFRPWTSMVAGAIGGAASSFLILMVLTVVCDIAGTKDAGWTTHDWRTDWSPFWREVLWDTRFFWPYMIMGVGLGVGIAAMTNAMWAARRWESFMGDASPMTGKQLRPTLGRAARFVAPFFWPVVASMVIADAIAFAVLRTAPSATDTPQWMMSWNGRLFGGTLSDAIQVRQWKLSAWGQGLAIVFDSVTQSIGGFCCGVGICLGLIVVRYGIRLDPKKP